LVFTKVIFGIITLLFPLFKNKLLDYIVMAIIDAIALKVARKLSGEIAIGRELESIIHWAIIITVFIMR
jgi:hypothetical protein